MNLYLILTLIGGAIGGFHNVMRTRERNAANGIANHHWADAINFFAGIACAMAATDALIPPDKTMWVLFAAMAAGAVGGYCIDVVSMIAPKLLPSILETVLAKFIKKD